MSQAYNFETLAVTKPADHVLHVELNRPNKRNAMNQQFFKYVNHQIAVRRQKRENLRSGKCINKKYKIDYVW